jgi:hypothetical protein
MRAPGRGVEPIAARCYAQRSVDVVGALAKAAAFEQHAAIPSHRDAVRPSQCIQRLAASAASFHSDFSGWRDDTLYRLARGHVVARGESQRSCRRFRFSIFRSMEFGRLERSGSTCFGAGAIELARRVPPLPVFAALSRARKAGATTISSMKGISRSAQESAGPPNIRVRYFTHPRRCGRIF